MHRAAVEPREILEEYLFRRAGGFVLFHTHPSGDPTPSDEDLQFTRPMAQAVVIVGVELVDHLVLCATGRWVSLQVFGWVVKPAGSKLTGAAFGPPHPRSATAGYAGAADGPVRREAGLP